MDVIDSHAHLEEVENLEVAIERARSSGVVAIVTVGSDYESNHQALAISERYKSFVYPALGLHPWSLAHSTIDRNLHFIEDNIENIVAIGEVGLDYHKQIVKGSSKELQQEVLASLLGLAKRFQKAAIIHSRYAWRDSFTVVRDSGIVRAIFHWYAGPTNVLREILARGYFASATLAAEYHGEHRRAIGETPLERLLVETDSPVLYRRGTPFEHRAEPADVLRAVAAVADLKGVEPGMVARSTTENAVALFGITLPRNGPR